jgi:hypothetical protein
MMKNMSVSMTGLAVTVSAETVKNAVSMKMRSEITISTALDTVEHAVTTIKLTMRTTAKMIETNPWLLPQTGPERQRTMRQ